MEEEMMLGFSRIKFVYEAGYESGTEEKVVTQFSQEDSAMHISEMLFQFDKFLKACGFGDCYKLIDKSQG